MRKIASTIAKTSGYKLDIAAENNFSTFDSFRTTQPFRSH